MTSDIVEQLRAWAEPISSWYEVPRAAVTLYEAADEIERLTAANAALRKDAERYRWLRDRAWPFEFKGDTPEDADAAIDKAIAQEGATDVCQHDWERVMHSEGITTICRKCSAENRDTGIAQEAAP